MCKKVKRKSVEIWGKQEKVEGKKKTRGMTERAKTEQPPPVQHCRFSQQSYDDSSLLVC